jgi:hypothetical protein
MDIREKLVELLDDIQVRGEDFTDYEIYGMRLPDTISNEDVASHLIAHGVTVQEHGYWETVVEVRDNTVCGNGAKIEYKRCSRCKNPAKIFEDDFCGHCGAKLDLPQPPKGE